MEQDDRERLGLLRERLRGADPLLHRQLEECWKTALTSWLPMMGHNEGSSNSYPHLRNVENHLDRIIYAFEGMPGTKYTDRLRPAEIYILLTAVLFHDIGRTRPDEPGGHGVVGQEFLTTQYPHLGISSEAIAQLLGRICVYHCPDKRATTGSCRLIETPTTVVEPYGEIREAFLAALLTLADCMDGAYTRALPLFLAPNAGKDAIGMYRRSIRGVYVDARARLIRTVVESQCPRQEVPRYFLKVAREDDWRAMDAVLRDKLYQLPAIKDIAERIPAEDHPPPAVKYLDKLQDKRFREGHLLADYNGHETFWPLLCLLTLNMLHLKPDEQRWQSAGEIAIDLSSLESDVTLREFFPTLAIILGNMRESCEILARIRDDLSAGGIVLATWAIERNGRLYNKRGRETYEPLFTPDYLQRAVRGMWDLTVQVFGTQEFSYRAIASQIGEPDIDKARLAVRRIAAATDHVPWKYCCEVPSDKVGQGAVWAGTTGWKWQIREHVGGCGGVALRTLQTAIRSLDVPDAAYDREVASDEC